MSNERTASLASSPAARWDPLAGTWTEPLADREPASPPAAPAAAARVPWLRAALAGGVSGALVASLILIPVLRRAPAGERRETRAALERTPSRAQLGAGRRQSVVDIAAAARPWVVNINTRSATLFGRARGTGSGVILSSDGYILTSAHVVDSASSIEVTLASGEKLKARKVGADHDTDVAVVKVNRTNLPPAVLGSARDLRVGELAIAIGSPLGLQQSVTEGIVSALGRTFPREDGGRPLVDMIQTDASITHGNSGGALIDGEGAVVGINTAIATSSGAAEGIAFATTIDIAVAVARELITTGHATHPWLGVTGSNVAAEAAAKFGVTEGARMVTVLPRSPAAKAGLRPDDVVVSFDGEPIKSMDGLVVAIRNHKVGQPVAIEIVRKGKHLTLRATLVEKP